MEPEQRIRRMEADGILSASQAAMLQESLASLGGAGATPPPHRIVPGWITAAGVLAFVAAGVMLLVGLAGGGPAVIQDVTRTLNEPGGYGEMNKSLSIVLGVAVLLVPPLLVWTWLHNSLVAREEKVFEAWAQTESNFQRRADLIPGVVDTVSRYLKHESETVTAVARERAAAAVQVPREIDELVRAGKKSSDLLREGGAKIVEDEERMERLVAAQQSLRQSMNNLFAVAEAYPELRSADQFLELQAQLEGTENRINVARMRFNDAVRDYNATLRMLPWSVVAALGDFQRKAYFRSEEEARSAPGLDFD